MSDDLSLDDLMAARIELRTGVKSGHPAKKALALQRLNAINEMIAAEKKRTSKS